MFCENCGCEINEKNKFCPKCGSIVQNSIGRRSGKDSVRRAVIPVIMVFLAGILLFWFVVSRQDKKNMQIQEKVNFIVDTWNNEEQGWQIIFEDASIDGNGEGAGHFTFIMDYFCDMGGYYTINVKDKEINIENVRSDTAIWLWGTYNYRMIDDNTMILESQDNVEDILILTRNGEDEGVL